MRSHDVSDPGRLDHPRLEAQQSMVDLQALCRANRTAHQLDARVERRRRWLPRRGQVPGHHRGRQQWQDHRLCERGSQEHAVVAAEWRLDEGAARKDANGRVRGHCADSCQQRSRHSHLQCTDCFNQLGDVHRWLRRHSDAEVAHVRANVAAARPVSNPSMLSPDRHDNTLSVSKPVRDERPGYLLLSRLNSGPWTPSAMEIMMKSNRYRIGILAAAISIVGACSPSASTSTGTGGSGSGGKTSTGGSVGSGGAAGSGGSSRPSGFAGSGGSVASGGSVTGGFTGAGGGAATAVSYTHL